MKQTLYQESHANQFSLKCLGKGYVSKYNYNNRSDEIIYQNQYSMQRNIESRTAKFCIENNHTDKSCSMKNCFLLLLNFTGKTKVQKVKEGSTTVYLLGTL